MLSLHIPAFNLSNLSGPNLKQGFGKLLDMTKYDCKITCVMTSINEIDPYHVRDLQMNDLWRAYSVVSAVCPRISSKQWHEYITPLLDTGDSHTEHKGACVLACPNDYFYGLFTYAVCRNLRFGWTLDVADFCVASLTSPKTGTDCLIRHAESVARKAGCQALSITFLNHKTDGPPPPWLALFRRNSFMVASPSVLKIIRQCHGPLA